MEIENAWFRPAVCYLVEVRGMSMKEVADMFGDYHQVCFLLWIKRFKFCVCCLASSSKRFNIYCYSLTKKVIKN